MRWSRLRFASRRNLSRDVVAVALFSMAAVATLGAVTVGAAGAHVAEENDAYVDAADEPCVLVSAGEVQSALGIADADGVGVARDLGTIGACSYGDSPGAVFQIANTFRTDAGRGVKEVCATAKASRRPDYRKVKGVGTRACAFTAAVLGRPAPTMVLYALRKDSTKTGRTIEMRISGSDEALATVDPRLDTGLATLGKAAAAFVKEEAID